MTVKKYIKKNHALITIDNLKLSLKARNKRVQAHPEAVKLLINWADSWILKSDPVNFVVFGTMYSPVTEISGR